MDTKKYTALNNKIVIKPVEVLSTLGNGIVIQETRGKKDIITGEVVIPNNGIAAGTVIWYPEYAGLPITLEGEHLIVIDYQDIILTNNGKEN